MARPRNTDRSQIRDARLSLAVPSNVYDGLFSLAQMKDVSVNDLICSVLTRLVETNHEVIQAYSADKQRHAAKIVPVDFDENVAQDSPVKNSCQGAEETPTDYSLLLPEGSAIKKHYEYIAAARTITVTIGSISSATTF